MSTIFTAANIPEFLARFYHCYDGVIQRVYVDMIGGAFYYYATVVLVVKDATLPDEKPWVEMRLVFDQVEEYVMRHGHGGYIQVLSGGVSIFFEADRLYFDFAWDDTQTVGDIRKSDLYFGAKSASWEIMRRIEV